MATREPSEPKRAAFFVRAPSEERKPTSQRAEPEPTPPRAREGENQADPARERTERAKEDERREVSMRATQRHPTEQAGARTVSQGGAEGAKTLLSERAAGNQARERLGLSGAGRA